MSRHWGEPGNFEHRYRVAEGNSESEGKTTAGEPSWRGDLVVIVCFAFAALCVYWWMF